MLKKDEDLVTDSDKIAFINEHKDKYRAVLQVAGTEYRRAQNENYWVHKFIEKAEEVFSQGRLVVCDDCRFPNEKAALGPYNVIDVWVENPELPKESEGIVGHASEGMGPEGANWILYNLPSDGLPAFFDKLEALHAGLRGLGDPNETPLMRREFRELRLEPDRHERMTATHLTYYDEPSVAVEDL
jgi:hypothetical protein